MLVDEAASKVNEAVLRLSRQNEMDLDSEPCTGLYCTELTRAITTRQIDEISFALAEAVRSLNFNAVLIPDNITCLLADFSTIQFKALIVLGAHLALMFLQGEVDLPDPYSIVVQLPATLPSAKTARDPQAEAYSFGYTISMNAWKNLSSCPDSCWTTNLIHLDLMVLITFCLSGGRFLPTFKFAMRAIREYQNLSVEQKREYKFDSTSKPEKSSKHASGELASIRSRLDTIQYAMDKIEIGFIFEDKFLWYQTIFSSASAEVIIEILAEVKTAIWVTELLPFYTQQKQFLRMLLTPLLGHENERVCCEAMKRITHLVDGHDWQREAPLLPKIETVGSDLRVSHQILVDSEDVEADRPPDNYYFGVYAPITNVATDDHYTSICFYKPIWSQPPEPYDHQAAGAHERTNGRSQEWWTVTCELGAATKCGFYDYRLFRYDTQAGRFVTVTTPANHGRHGRCSKYSLAQVESCGENVMVEEDINLAKILKRLHGGKIVTLAVQGRIVVQPRNIQRANLCELSVDHFNQDAGDNTRNSTFADVMKSIPELATSNISGIFLGPVMERDTGRVLPNGTFERPAASPFSVVCRKTPSRYLGGATQFKELMSSARANDVKLYIDAPIRVAATHYHRKYDRTCLRFVSADGTLQLLRGGSGKARTFYDTVQLNMRDARVWDTYLDDLKYWVKTMGVDGIRMDNLVEMPSYYPIDTDELSHRDSDLSMHYSQDDILAGIVVKKDGRISSGMYSTEQHKSYYAHPIVVYICKELWRMNPNLGIFADCGIVESNHFPRVGCLCRSGIIPFVSNLPSILPSLLGKQLNDDGHVQEIQKQTASILSAYQTELHKNVPANAIIVQSSFTANSPLPALLYGEGVWSATDYLFLAADLPCTRIEEHAGSAFRRDISKFYKVRQDAIEPHARDCHLCNPINTNQYVGKVKTLSGFADSKDAQILQDEFNHAIRSRSDRDYSQLAEHYRKLRNLRKNFEQIRNSVLIPVKAVDRYDKAIDEVYAFCKIDAHRNVIFGAINFSYQHIEDVCIDLAFLRDVLLPKQLSPTTICEIWNLGQIENSFDERSMALSLLEADGVDAIANGSLSLLTLPQLFSFHQHFSIGSHNTILKGLKLIDNPFCEDLCQKALYISAMRDAHEIMLLTKKELNNDSRVMSRALRSAIDSNYIIGSIKRSISNPWSIDEVADIIKNIAVADTICGNLYKMRGIHHPRFNLYKVLKHCKLFEDDPPAAAAFVAKLKKIQSRIAESMAHEECIPKSTVPVLTKLTSSDTSDSTEPIFSSESQEHLIMFSSIIHEYVQEYIDSQAIGEIVFVTPELGKYCTVGGLGVMVDDLASTLKNYLGFNVTLLIPYYNVSTCGARDYIKQYGIKWTRNIDICLNGETLIFGVHEGYDRGMRLLFLHNESVFPCPYPDVDVPGKVKFISAIGKAFLELLCQIRLIPNILITNDWPCGLIPCYAKLGFFGDAFKRTKFLHIFHNLHPDYEGRVYCKAHDDFFHIHGLPRDAIIDNYWTDTIINPSRTAALFCDNWSTVSPGYLDELLGRSDSTCPSPLSPILNLKPHPFSTCNGIPLTLRKQEIAALGLTRTAAKKELQRKYFGLAEGSVSIPLYSFIGRITSQKGVLMILEIAESLITQYKGQIQILVGGKVTWNDPYSAKCGRLMYELRDKYPSSFFANPELFFRDCKLVNLGSDFALMPSQFEPGGIVQHEFFVANTPVIAYNTGGLRCTVTEFESHTGTGNGFLFHHYSHGDFMHAWQRSIRTFFQPTQMEVIRRNAGNSVVTCEDCSVEWAKEIHRLTGKIYTAPTEINRAYDLIDASSHSIQNIKRTPDPLLLRYCSTRGLTKDYDSRQLCVLFQYRGQHIARNVAITGSFCQWQAQHQMKHSAETGFWEIYLSLEPNRYEFKFIVDGNWLCSSNYDVTTYPNGNINNEIYI